MTSAMEVNSWAQLVQAMGGPTDGSRAEIIFLKTETFTPNGPISVTRPIFLRTLDGDVTINRPGTMALPFFNVDAGGTLTLQGSNGMLTLDGGGFSVNYPLIQVNPGGTLNMHDMVHLQNNHNTDLGGAVRVEGGIFHMSGGIIGSTTIGLGNRAQSGGGVYVAWGTFAMFGNASVYGNEATGALGSTGGGVFVVGSLFGMSEDASIRNNRAHAINTGNSGTGGGVAVGDTGAIFEMRDNALVSGNQASGDDGPGFGHGGGVYVDNLGSFRITGGRVNGGTEPFEPNTAGGFGSSLFAVSTATQVAFGDPPIDFATGSLGEVERNNTITGAGSPGP